MTEFFEVHGRDAAARIGELRLSEPVRTPALAVERSVEDPGDGDVPLVDSGSLWSAPRDAEADPDSLTVLPHRGFPAGTAPEVEDAFDPDLPALDAPSAAVVSQRSASDAGTDAYVLAGAQGFIGHAAAFREAIIETREAIPADSALYVPGVATPANVALLVYAGVDLVDADAAVVEGTRGRYLTTEGDRALDRLDELPCACPACRGGIEAFEREDCAAHNEFALRAELARVRTRIREGRLRDYLESQSRTEPWLTAGFREFDGQWSYLAERTPIQRNSLLAATTEDALRRPEIQRFADRVCSRYTSRFTDLPLLLVPCSARKPYSESKSHNAFQDAARYRGHLVSITSPIGAVPRELELTYPAQHYDAAVTGHWSASETEFVAEVLSRYLDGNDYPRIVAHIPEEYRPIVERATAEQDLPVEYTVVDHPTDDDSLANLAAALEGERQIRVEERERQTMRAVADWQFGAGAGDALLDDFELKGRYPKSKAYADGEQVAALVPNYGTLSFTIAGARRWAASDAPTKRVEIDGFVPRGSVLAPGVVDADESIRVGDEVLIEGPKAFGVGRAEAHGAAMVESTRGIACKPRHVVEK
jgi:archaeosine synthase